MILLCKPVIALWWHHKTQLLICFVAEALYLTHVPVGQAGWCVFNLNTTQRCLNIWNIYTSWYTTYTYLGIQHIHILVYNICTSWERCGTFSDKYTWSNTYFFCIRSKYTLYIPVPFWTHQTRSDKVIVNVEWCGQVNLRMWNIFLNNLVLLV